jgi:hypothetical protein
MYPGGVIFVASILPEMLKLPERLGLLVAA